MRTVGQVIRARRGELGLTLGGLAGRVGCAKSYLSELENEKRDRPPSREMVARLEAALGLKPGELGMVRDWHATPAGVKREVLQMRSRGQAAAGDLIGVLRERGLDGLHRSGELRRVIEAALGSESGELSFAQDSSEDGRERLDDARDRVGAHGEECDGAEGGRDACDGGRCGSEVGGRSLRFEGAMGRVLPVQVPVINGVRAGRAMEYTDLGYPPGVGDDYVSIPDLYDPDAFAARVVGDSMAPDYREGDLVVFSPLAPTADGCDCFVRFERDDESTFKRVYFEERDGGVALIRLQPLNSRYPPRVVEREAVAMLCAAVSMVRRVGGDGQTAR